MIHSILDYHELTSYRRSKMQAHSLDWSNQPTVFKSYPHLKSLPLPEPSLLPEENLSEILSGGLASAPPKEITVGQVSSVLHLAQTMTAKRRYPGGDLFYRSVPSAGALYPCELYVAVHSVRDLKCGLYHYSILNHSLTLLRSGDIRDDLISVVKPADDTASGLTCFVTAIFFRSAWKYRERAYRYHLLDAGHLVENLCLALRALMLPPSLKENFTDDAVNHLLCVDDQREVCLAIVAVPVQGVPPSSASGSGWLKDLSRASRVAPREMVYPAIREMHHLTATQKAGGSGEDIIGHLGVELGDKVDIPKIHGWPEVLNHTETVRNRRSSRSFVNEMLSESYLKAMLSALRDAQAPPGLCTGFLAGRVGGFEPGFYIFDPANSCSYLSHQGELTAKMARICLDQAWLSRAALQFLFMTNLEYLDRIFGPRGYRYAMLGAGRLGQRIYLAATAMGLGACGIGAFYDQAAAECLGLQDHSRLLYLVAAGPIKT